MFGPKKYILRDYGGIFADISKTKTSLAIIEQIGQEKEEFKKFREQYIDRYRTGKISIQSIQKKYEKIHGKTNINFGETIENAFTRTTTILKSNLALVKKAKQKGFTNVVASDAILEHKNAIQKLDGYHNFEKTFISCDIGYSKYDDVKNNTSKFFDYILNDLAIDPENCIFIDDRIDNISVAQKRGLHTYQVSNIQELETTIKDIFK